MSKSMRTGTIRYNITDRNRKYVGQPRNFNVPKVVALINSGAVQELVTKGDLYGYLGHGVRKEYGLMPNELGVATCADGQIKLTPIDPCLRTISIKAYEDGTIEHEAEFLDNHLGRTAWQWHTNKVGGFPAFLRHQQKILQPLWALIMYVCPITTVIEDLAMLQTALCMFRRIILNYLA